MYPTDQVKYIRAYGMTQIKHNCDECNALIGYILVHEEGGLVMMIAPPNAGFDFTDDHKRLTICNGCSKKLNIQTSRGCIYDKRFE
jgi:hypothetical protein